MDPQLNVPQISAHEFVAMAAGYLEQRLGRESNLKDLAEFAETIGASVLGSMYAQLREREGKETSEAWLKKALSTMCGNVRLAGADALVKVEVAIKDMPNRMTKREEAPKAPAPSAPPQESPVCKCKIEGDLKCFTCLRILSSCVGTVFKNTMDMAKIGSKIEDTCEVCKASLADEVLSKIVPDLLKAAKTDEKAIEQIAVVATHVGTTLGAQALPLTQAAIKEVLADQ